MPTLPDAHIQGLAESCVHNMGDIFWDYDERRDAPLDYTEPRRVAAEAVATTLHEFASTIESNSIYNCTLRLEYREIVSRVGNGDDDEQLVAALIDDAAWSDRGARHIVQLAKDYGTSILRNALALAEALNIEDGEAGF